MKKALALILITALLVVPVIAAETPTFTDTNGHWGQEFIDEAAQRGLFKGFGDGTFRPDTAVTRAQFVTVLWRMAGNPAVTAQTPFTDIADQIDEFRTAIAWAYEKGYVNGTTETTFAPGDSLTRESAMKILFGYAGGQSGMEAMFTNVYDSVFTDSSAISAWAKAPMYWGVYNTLISGTGDKVLSPQGIATRAQLAKILVNYIEKFEGGRK